MLCTMLLRKLAFSNLVKLAKTLHRLMWMLDVDAVINKASVADTVTGRLRRS